MTVIGRGDLSPPRRHHRHRGRNRLLLLLLLATLGVGAWFGWQALRGDDNAAVRSSGTPCVQPTHPPAPAAAHSVHVRVLNGTNRAGLAHDVAQRLRARGLRIAGVGNSPRRSPVTTINHATADLAAALTVAEQLTASSLQTADVKVVTLVIGRDFHRLASKQSAAKARTTDLHQASPSPSPCPSPSG